MARPRNRDQDENPAAEPGAEAGRTRKSTSAKKTSTAKKTTGAKKTTAAKKSSTAKRSSSSSSSRSEPTHDDIARRAYEISIGPDSGSAEENWHRAVRELRGDQPDPGGPWAKIGSGNTDSMTSD